MTLAVALHPRIVMQRELMRDRGRFLINEAVTVFLAEGVTKTLDTTPEGQTKLMVVDDDPEVRVIVAEFLEDFGYSVLQASSGAEALELLASAPDLRMMITDIRMPDMTGIELANVATQRHRDLKIILISGYFVSQQIEHRFLRKPFRMRDLEAAVRTELEAQ